MCLVLSDVGFIYVSKGIWIYRNKFFMYISQPRSTHKIRRMSFARNPSLLATETCLLQRSPKIGPLSRWASQFSKFNRNNLTSCRFEIHRMGSDKMMWVWALLNSINIWNELRKCSFKVLNEVCRVIYIDVAVDGQFDVVKLNVFVFFIRWYLITRCTASATHTQLSDTGVATIDSTHLTKIWQLSR